MIESYLNGFTVGYRKPFVVEKEVTAADLADREKISAASMPGLAPEERKHNFNQVMFGFPDEIARKEADRCLECGCLDYFKCKLLKYSREYNVDPVPYMGAKSKFGKDATHPYIIHDNDKCILCGQCVRVCDEVMGVTALGLVNRGFVTVVSPEFFKNFDSSRCISCGQCVALCPTGALEAKVPFRKNIPLDTVITKTVCSGCANLCEMNVHTYGGSVIRCEPGTQTNILCRRGAFGTAEIYNSDKRVKQCTVDGKSASRQEAMSALAGRLSGVTVLLNSSMSNEEADAAIGFAKANSAAGVLHFNSTDATDEDVKIFGEKRRLGANIAGFKARGIEEYKGQKLDSAAVFGGALPQLDCEIVAAETNEPVKAQIVLAPVSDLESSGTYTDENGKAVSFTACFNK